MSEHQKKWVAFAAFVSLFLAKNITFHWFCFYEWLPVGQNGFFAWIGFVLPKIASAIAFASIAFFLKDKRWMLAIALVVDTWCIANWIYMRNNNFLLDSFAFNIAGNLNGYWWSVLVFIEFALDICMYICSVVFCIVVGRYTKTEKRSWGLGMAMLISSIVIHYMGEEAYILAQEHNNRPSFCWDIMSREGRERVYGIDYEYLVSETSLLSMPLYLLPDHIEIKAGKEYRRPMSVADEKLAASYWNAEHIISTKDTSTTQNSSDKLILIICESLENWVCCEDIMPHLSAITKMDHVLYADNIKTQIVGAPSADGQMIINTGLLPLTEGYTCFRYPHNHYPGLMQLTADSSVLILPHDTAVWNQTMMSPAYGYDTTIIYTDLDDELFEKLNEVQRSGITHIQCITQSTHAPFVSCERSNLSMPKDMPFFMSRFIRAFNTLDNGLAHFVDRIANDSLLREYTIVITADHHILYREKREKYEKYAVEQNLPYHPISAALPLIIYSPKIEGNQYVSTPCYQMDIYPTILSLLNVKNSQWKGFGVNILDNEALTHRQVDEQQIFLLSDKLIRNNWFKGRIEP